MPKINNCPGTLAEGFNTYSKTCLKKVFYGKKVHHVLPYNSPATSGEALELFEENQKRISISGVQEKFSMLMDKNKLRLLRGGEKGTYILKPIPKVGRRLDQMPANEHLTMQIAKQVFGIETAENALIFFENGEPAYITKRFDVNDDGTKRHMEDFATLAGRTPQTHGREYKYEGSYYELFELMKQHLPAYKLEALKLFKLIVFNYLFSNGDAHFKNFSILETSYGDFRLSPAYDLLNSGIHIEDSTFALFDGLVPRKDAQGNVRMQFYSLGELAGFTKEQVTKLLSSMTCESEEVEKLVKASFLNDKTKRSYLQMYQTRLGRLLKE